MKRARGDRRRRSSLSRGGIRCAFYLARNPEKRSLDERARSTAPGKFVRLSDGVTHYELLGPDTGATVVLVHGFSVPYYIWDSTAVALVESRAIASFATTSMDAGGPIGPTIAYDAAMYDRQLGELLDSLAHRRPVHLAGVSMGGWVTGTFAGRHPDRVRSLILVDPVAGESGGPPSGFRIPAVGPLAWQALVVPTMADGQLSDFVHPDRFPDWTDRYREQMQFRGFGRALLSTLSARTGVAMDSVYHVVATANVPVLLIWGMKDKTVPFASNAVGSRGDSERRIPPDRRRRSSADPRARGVHGFHHRGVAGQAAEAPVGLGLS